LDPFHGNPIMSFRRPLEPILSIFIGQVAQERNL
jgi:hypothetical protein